MNIAIVAVIMPHVENLIDNSIRKLIVVNIDECGNDDYNIIKAVEKNLCKEFKTQTVDQISVGIRMNIVKRDKIINPKLSADEICTKFLLDEVFGIYM